MIEESLENFLEDTEFPYTASASGGGQMDGPGNGERPGDGQKPDGDFPGEKPDGGNFEDMDDITRNDTSSGISLDGTYETVQDYIDALNADGEWVSYDASTGTVTIKDIASFVQAFKRLRRISEHLISWTAGRGKTHCSDTVTAAGRTLIRS